MHVAVRKLQIVIIACSSREMSQTVCIDRLSVLPLTISHLSCLNSRKKPLNSRKKKLSRKPGRRAIVLAEGLSGAVASGLGKVRYLN